MELDIGQRLVNLRTKRGLTQEQLAKMLNMSRSTYAQYEVNRRTPDAETLTMLANFFNVTTDYLFGRTDIPNPDIPNEKIKAAITDDPDLLAFWEELSQREDLQLMFKQVRDLTPNSIKKIVRIIKAIEDEEANED